MAGLRRISVKLLMELEFNICFNLSFKLYIVKLNMLCVKIFLCLE